MANPDDFTGITDTGISTDSTRGATIRTAYAEREVKAYAIFENEVQTLTMWNTLAGIFMSLGAACLSFAVGIWTNAAFAEKLTPEGVIFSKFVAPTFCLLTLVSWGIAIWAVYSRSRTWEDVKAETKAQHYHG
jgi:hypothetical protein